MEYNILSTLDFDFTFPTSLRFLERYMKITGEDRELMFYSLFLIELALVDIQMLRHGPAIIAAAALFLAYKQRLKQMNSQPD